MTRLLRFLILTLMSVTSQHAVAEVPAAEKQLIKAAYIYNFARYTNWSENARRTDDSLKFCIAGNDELTDELMRLNGKTVKNRPIEVFMPKDIQEQKNCHLLYIASSEKKHYIDFLAALSGKAVLTVSELSGFSRSGGIIELYREDNQTRFIINLDAANTAGLAISSRLLILAVVIDSEATP